MLAMRVGCGKLPVDLDFLRLDSKLKQKNASSFRLPIMEGLPTFMFSFPAEWSDLGDWSAFSQHLSQASPPTESGTLPSVM